MLEIVDSTEAASERMMNLLSSFGQSATIPETNPSILVQNIAKLAEKVATNMKINLEIADDAKNLKISKSRLLPMVFDNLFRNASIHAGEKPVVRTEISRQGDFVVITISDNGPGVSEEIRERLFQRGASTRRGGLGLYLSKKIVEAMNGSLVLEDSKDRKGATFVIRLPVK